MRFPAGERTSDLVVKVALDGAGMNRLQAEREALERLGAAAVGAGVTVPIIGGSPHPWLSVSAPLPGVSAAALLARDKSALEPVAHAVAGWLLRWNIATASRVAEGLPALAQTVVEPLRRVREAGFVSESYFGAIMVLAGQVQRRGTVSVSAHNDLTMANVLAGDSGLSIIDWEEGRTEGHALGDLWYMLADAVARAHDISHERAVEALVMASPLVPPGLARLPAQHAARMGLSGLEARLAFHACWLGHADDELRRGSENRPFTAIVRALSGGRLRWPESCASGPPE